MKANRKFVLADDAVSPVIAVILMVAITVVLAATVFVLVSDIGSNQKSGPTVSLRTDETNDRVIVDSGASNADWQRIQVKVNLASRFLLNGDPIATTGTALAANTWSGNLAAAQDLMSAGEFVGFCTSDAVAGPATIDFRDSVSNEGRGSYQLTNLAIC